MPSNDLISRKYIIKELLKEREKFPAMVEERYSFGVKIPRKFNQALRGGIRKALRIAETAPAVDAEPVRRGRWEWKEGAAYCTAHKGKLSPNVYGYAHCPWCGARMDGV